MPKQQKGLKPRIPFDAQQIAQLFSAPAFVGCQGPRRRFDEGPYLLRDAYFWIPILGYYTGARLSELVQMHLADVCLDGPIPYLDFNEVDGQGDAACRKHLKSAAAVRKVPLHDDVLALGFAEFVQKRKADKRAMASRRLFFEVPYGADGQPGTVFSKWFARLMDRADLDDPRLVFHSFRHTAEDALRNALQPSYVINRIIGHDEGHISGVYGAGVSLATMREAINAMKLPISITAVAGLKI